jgi:hypothetical protein
MFSPIAYKKCRKWQKEGVGREYFDYCKTMELANEPARFEYKE